jgi:hypothetical protein
MEDFTSYFVVKKFKTLPIIDIDETGTYHRIHFEYSSLFVQNLFSWRTGLVKIKNNNKNILHVTLHCYSNNDHLNDINDFNRLNP